MAYPIRFIGTDLTPLVIDDDYEVIDKQQLAEWIAELLIGHYMQMIFIINGFSAGEPATEDSSINHAISFLDVAQENDTLIEHRDGLLFQMMSWIALNIKLISENSIDKIRMAAPHSRPAEQGFDNLALVLTENNEISRIILTEDKCTNDPRTTIHGAVYDEFKKYEKGTLNTQITNKLTELVSPTNNLDLYFNISPNFANLEYRTYRIGINRKDCHNSETGRKRLFKDFETVVIGDVIRRKGATIYIEQLRPWMQDLSDLVMNVLKNKKHV